MPPDIPSLWASRDAPDYEREEALAEQALLPPDLVNPADAMGDEAWNSAVNADFLMGGRDALADFQREWGWNMSPQQRASALAKVAFEREMDSLINEAAGMSKPPVDPEEFAESIRVRRSERARRI